MKVERGPAIYRAQHGLPLLYHVRLKHQGRTLAVLSGNSEKEARQRAQRLVDGLSLDKGGVAIEPA